MGWVTASREEVELNCEIGSYANAERCGVLFQRQRIRLGFGRLDARYQQGAALRGEIESRHGLDQLLRPIRFGVALRRIQAVWLGPLVEQGGARVVHGEQVRVRGTSSHALDIEGEHLSWMG
jgi:hypothetical protein